MASRVGFILLTHRAPLQILRLINKLDVMFDKPPIVCHHDFDKCDLPESQFPSNVTFVRPHLTTSWAHWSVVEATVLAIEQLYRGPQAPEWFVILSGADYPIKPAKEILAGLESGDYDAHIHFMPIKANELISPWRKLAYERYCTKQILYASLSKSLRPCKRSLTLRHPFLTGPFLPFNKRFTCYGGSQWFSGNKRVADRILDFHRQPHPLKRHYSNLQFSEESYFQTILGNTPNLKLNNNNWRFISWRGQGPFPRTLVHPDLPAILDSPDHFARKFDSDIDHYILDALDAVTA